MFSSADRHFFLYNTLFEEKYTNIYRPLNMLLFLSNSKHFPTLKSFYVNLLKPTGHVMHQQFNIQQLYALPTLFMCFVFIWEQTAICATYSIN